jgi:hypothetical protein
VLIVLGIWGALVPFIGPYLDYSWASEETWRWTVGRWWLEVLPGLVTILGGWLVFVSGTRIGSWLAALAGSWFVIGQSLSAVWHLGSVGTPLSLREGGQAAAQLGYFYGVGVLILLLAAGHLGAARPAPTIESMPSE